MGVRLEFSDEKMIFDLYTGELKNKDLGDKMYITTREEFEELERAFNIREEYNGNKVFVGTPDEFEEQLKKDIEWSKRIDGKFVIDLN
jgi:alkanesulfonate monooxygenase SsuD/methylene tetrahydromethanopterin reductase-like flavin-dependent oxidoreductase (luciferase family)